VRAPTGSESPIIKWNQQPHHEENTLHLGLDVHKDSITLDIAQYSPKGVVRPYGTIPNDLHAAEKVLGRYRRRHEGVGEAILKEAVPWRKVAFYRGEKTLLDLDLSGEVKPENAYSVYPRIAPKEVILAQRGRSGLEMVVHKPHGTVVTMPGARRIMVQREQLGETPL
jgi:hypothetical protein